MLNLSSPGNAENSSAQKKTSPETPQPETRLPGKPLVGPTGKLYPNMRDVTEEIDYPNAFQILGAGPIPKVVRHFSHLTPEEAAEDEAFAARRYKPRPIQNSKTSRDATTKHKD